ncbi:hypothetical protein FA95DRAFT_1158367 [Auriscalpium vulgare]|uniref:Uncharacterized protein n=1 Tax=Auriscalpium vulgare TaxID=40419 RepID=A0ACB8S9E4_9AGAM|nr:hypothetical protein FA95DRAFT_1158367 [Auriscalpium vulgare]
MPPCPRQMMRTVYTGLALGQSSAIETLRLLERARLTPLSLLERAASTVTMLGDPSFSTRRQSRRDGQPIASKSKPVKAEIALKNYADRITLAS